MPKNQRSDLPPYSRLLEQDYELVPINELKPHPENPRKGNLDAIG